MLKFGTSGIRGLVSELTDSEVYHLVEAFLIHAESKGQLSEVAIACDLRESSPRIKAAAEYVVHRFGRDTLDCGTVPTPALALITQETHCLGIMITGSHIPADRNGLKFYLESGETLKADDAAIFEIYQKLQTSPIPTRAQNPGKNKNFIQNAKTIYIDRYLNFFPKNILAGYKFLFYEHSSVSRDIFPEILKKLGASIICLGRSEIFIPVDTEAIDTTEQFQTWLRQYAADGLISTDGDGDRPLVIDENGRVIQGDKLGAMTSIYLGIEALATPISSNSGILSNPSFKKTEITKIGSPYVVDALNHLEKSFSLVAGFEANGGYILQTDIKKGDRTLRKLPSRDAILPVICAFSWSKSKGLKISEAAQELTLTCTASGLLRNFSAEKCDVLLTKISENPTRFFEGLLPEWKLKLHQVNNLDGHRYEFEDGLIIHLRPSGNAPEFRCYTEAKNQKMADRLCSEVLNKIDGYCNQPLPLD